MLEFECPQCKTKMQAADEHVGKTAVCPGCAQTVTIPSSTSAITADPAVSVPSAPPAEAIATPEHARAAKKKPATDDDEDDDRPRKRDGGSDGAQAAAAAGMSVAMILVIIGGVGLCLLCVPAILIALLVPAVQKVREAAARTQSMNNMKQIGLAFHAHHDVNKSFPSQKLGAELSWRVALLPYLDQGPLFTRMDMTSDWDKGANAGTRTMQVVVYIDPQRPGQVGETEYQVFTGPNALFPDPRFRPTLGNIPDGPRFTFLIAQAQTPVPWSKPADMTVTPDGALPLPKDRFIAAFADGSVRMFDRDRIQDATLRMMIDPRDGQALPPID